jgi:ABC-type multidrug transport system ATPase subunit
MQLTISNLNKTYPNGVQALKGIDLVIEQGMFGLLGPNGAGKSSLMRTIATLQEADSGSIFLDELDVLKEKETVSKNIRLPAAGIWRISKDQSRNDAGSYCPLKRD